MAAVLEALHKLYLIDAELYRCQHQVQDKDQLIRQNQRRLTTLRAEAAAKHEASQRQQAENDRVNVDVKQKEEHVAKLRLALTSTRTNKDYTAILGEINNARADLARLEDIVLNGMARVDEMAKEEATLNEQASQIEERLNSLQADRAERATANEGRVGELETARSEAIASVPGSILEEYERIKEYHEGDHMAPVTSRGKGRSKEWGCGGCHMQIRVEQVNSLVTRDEVQICDNCGRMLYVTEELTGGLTK